MLIGRDYPNAGSTASVTIATPTALCSLPGRR